MLLLSEQQAQHNPQLLSQAWAGAETFVFVPDKSAIDAAWIQARLALLPAELTTRHYVLLTSGSTGLPKLIVGRRDRTEELAATLHKCQYSEAVEETILVLPLSYSYAFVNQWVWSQCFRRKLTVTNGLREPEALGAVLENGRNAMLCLVGVQVPLLVQWFQTRCFPGIIRVHFAGGRFPQENLDRVRSLFPQATIFNNYGCAEALPRLTLRKAEEAPEASNIGRPLPGVELAANEANELLFRSRYGAVGVVEENAFSPITQEQWVKTGDLAQPGNEDTWKLLGRANEVFKRHGEKISLATLVTTVSRFWPGQAAFYKERDRSGEEGHVLVIAPAPSAEELKDILKAFRKHHSRAHWPLRIESAEALPLLPNGKTDAQRVHTTQGKAILWRQTI